MQQRVQTVLGHSLALLLLAVSLQAQQAYSIWHFGYYAGVDFRGGDPVAGTGPFYTDEGSSMWCNPVNGSLVLSSEGRRIYRADGTVIPNSNGLRGGPSSSNCVVIVPDPLYRDPSKAQRLYVFCIGDLSWDPAADDSALTMNLVDFSTDTQGSIVLKNVVVDSGFAEKLAVTHHCDGRTFWVVVHAKEEPVFYAYRLTESGLQPPVVSRVGHRAVPPSKNVRGGAFGQGLLAFSSDGTKLAMAVPFSYLTEVFDFDSYTGVVSNARVLDTMSRNYGVCFSPSGALVYAVEWATRTDGGPMVRQYDVSGQNAPLALGRLRDPLRDFELGGIQLGPDGKVWMAEPNGIASIGSPDVQGFGCDFLQNRVGFSAPARVSVGLPTLVTSFYNITSRSVCAPPISAIVADSVVCEDECLVFRDDSRNVPTSWTWSFQGGVPETYSGKTPPQVCYSTPGIYTVSLITTNAFGSDTAQFVVHVIQKPLISAGPDITLCDSSAGRLQASGGVRYEWEYKNGIGNILAPNPIVRVFEHTEFVVRGWNAEGCSATDTVVVYSYPEGKAAVNIAVRDVVGTAGERQDVVIEATNGVITMPTLFDIHIPGRTMYDVIVTQGREVSRSRENNGDLTITLESLTGSEVVAILNGVVLAFQGQDTIVCNGTPSDSCDVFLTRSGTISSSFCGVELRAIRFHSVPLDVLEVSGTTVVVQGNARARVQVCIYNLLGEALDCLEGTLQSGPTAFTMNVAQHGIVVVVVRSGSVAASAVVVH